MVLPALPTDEEFRSLKTFPFQEGRHFEFKSSIQCSKHKVLPTVCGFLNVGGGHMIFGIADDLTINGFTASTRELDTFLLYIDNIVRNGAVLKENNEVIKPEQITTRIIKLDNMLNILIITIASEEGAKYQLKEGVVYYRLNASNYRVTNNRYYTESQMTMMIRDKGHMIHKEYSGLIAGMDKEIKRTCEEIAKRDKALAESHLYMSKANRDLAHVNQMLTEHILAEKVRVENQMTRRWCFLC
jgi:hypothetical protein